MSFTAIILKKSGAILADTPECHRIINIANSQTLSIASGDKYRHHTMKLDSESMKNEQDAPFWSGKKAEMRYMPIEDFLSAKNKQIAIFRDY